MKVTEMGLSKNPGKLEMKFRPCFLCGSDKYTQLVSNDRYDLKTKTKGCNQCGLVQMMPRPTEKSLLNFYENTYRSYYQSYENPDEEYLKTYKKEQRLENTVSLIEKYVNIERLSKRHTVRILDYGCSEGSLFVAMREKFENIELLGVEANNKYAEYAEKRVNCKVFSSLKEVKSGGVPKFDLIVVNHVLEHLTDPIETMRGLGSLLKPHGALFIDVPDASKYKNILDFHIAHLIHFDEVTLASCLKAAGFSPEVVSAHEPPNHPASIFTIAKFNESGLGSSDIRDDREHRPSWDRCLSIQKKVWIYILLYRARNIPGIENLRKWVKRQ